MPGAVLPYSPAETEAAARWIDYVADAYASGDTVADGDSAAREAIDKLERRGLIGPGTAALLAEIFDIAESAEFAFA